jgi:hypothetical protein
VLLTAQRSSIGVCTVLAMGVAALGQTGDLVGSLIDQAGRYPEEYLRLSPIIIAATVISNEETGRLRPSIWLPDMRVQPHKVVCQVEEVIRLDNKPLPAGELDFLFFATELNAYNPFHKVPFQAVPGRRYLFALIRQGSGLRSIGDVGDYSVGVYSGFHPPTTRVNGKSLSESSQAEIGNRISQILLQRGDGLDPAEFSLNLAKYILIAEALSSHLQTYNLLHTLLRDSHEPSVQASACFELNRYFPGQYECLERLQYEERQDTQARLKARERLEEARRVDEELLKSLRDPAWLGTSNLLKPDSREQNYEQLQILLGHPKALFRNLACAALQRYYPHRPASACDARQTRN